MRKLFITIFCAICTLTAMAQTQGTNRLVVHKGDNTIVGYAINNVDSITFDAIGEVKATPSVVSTDENSLKINIQRSADCASFYLAYEIASQWNGEGTVAERVKAINHTTIDTDGQQHLQSLHSGETYNVYTLAFDKYGVEGEAQMLTVKVGTGEEDMFTITLSNITCNNVGVKITPKDPNMYYSWATYTQERYDQIINQYGDLNGFDNAWWNFVAEQYGISWEEAMQGDLSSGVTNEPQSEWLYWDSDYVVAVYGVDYNDGAPLTKITTAAVHTLAPTPSDNVITVELGTVYRDGVDVTVTTTNDDTYLVGAERADYVNYYASNEALMKAWLSDVHDNATLKHNGDDSFKKTVMRADTDYFLIVVGFNGGPTTNVQLIPFHTLAQ